ncbi:MAG: sulfatase-like hydrolase/transferase [Pseudomonadota bacterium]
MRVRSKLNLHARFSRWVAVWIIALGLSACANDATDPVRSVSESDAAARPNIVLILFEDMSPRVGSFGDRLAHTPNFDRLAAEGVRYTNVFTTSGVCAPSRAALITGQYQQTIGAQHMRTMAPAGGTGGGPQGYFAVPPPHIKAFPERLRAVGYYTSNNSKTDYQFGQPFTIWNRSEPGADWSQRAAGQPFFHMVSLFNTHESAIWPVDMEKTPANQDFYGLVSRNRQAFKDRVARTDPDAVSVPPYLPDTPIVRRDIATHYDNIAHTDRALGALYDRLAAEGLLANTIVIVSSDHGDGLPRMKRSLYDSGLHVPMVIRYPDGREAGTVNDELISFVDLAPTILSWADAPNPDHLAGFDFEGDDRDPSREYIFAAQDRMDFDPNHRRAVRDRRFKLIQNFSPGDRYFVPLAFRDVQPTMRELWNGLEAGTLSKAAQHLFEPMPEFQLYDLASDPHEIRNLSDAPEHAATVTRLKTVLDDWMLAHPDMSRVPEADMIQAMWPDGVQPVTAAPTLTYVDHAGARRVELRSTTDGASIGFRLNTSSEDWTLYTGPFDVPSGSRVQAKAIRYGFKESAIVTFDPSG